MVVEKNDKNEIKKSLNIFLIIVATLVAIGMIFIYSSSSVYAMEKFGSANYFVKKQLIGLLLGLVGIFVIFLLPIKIIKKYCPYFFWSSLILTCGTMVPGISQRIHGSARWIKLPGLSFQPSELLKISVIIYIAYFIAKKQNNLKSFFKAYLPVMIILGFTSLILLRQPDFGLTVTIASTILVMLFVAKFNYKHLLLTFGSLVPAAIILVALKPYRLQRILTFLNPWQDPKGSGFQIIQSLIAIGSGGLWGVGITNSKQKFFYLPMQHTDFIFSIIAEESGLIGCLCIIILFIALLFFGIKISTKIQDTFSRYSVLGLVILISIQAIINLAVATGLAPTKGIGLPLVSYGNTSLVCTLCIVGLIINIAYSNANNKE